MARTAVAVDGKIPTVEDLEEFVLASGSESLDVFGGRYVGGAYCQQMPEEIAPCFHAILESGRRIESYLEIGVAAGGSTWLVNQVFHPVNIVLIDDNQHPKVEMRKQVLAGVQRTELIGQSTDEGVVNALRDTGMKFDLIFIDGDHSYEGARADVDLYLPFLLPGGFMFLHDSCAAQYGDVDRVVREMKTDKRIEFIGEHISAKHPTPCGIALFRGVTA
jgi:predicted O-methyltransferase YrrM